MHYRNCERYVRLDAAPVAKRIGLIILSTDFTTERDFARIFDPDDVAIYANRISFTNPVNAENLKQMGTCLTGVAAEILPGHRLDLLVYACTAASILLGDEQVAQSLNLAKSSALVITPAAAAVAAFTAMNVKRISILTPYPEPETVEIVNFFSKKGFDIDKVSYLNVGDDRDIARIAPDCILDAAASAVAPASEALFISCTALRAMEVVGRIEQETNIPVITSNQAMVWQCVNALEYNRRFGQYGRIFSFQPK